MVAAGAGARCHNLARREGNRPKIRRPPTRRIASGVVAEWLSAHDRPRSVTFCCFGPADARVYRDVLAERGVAFDEAAP